MNDEHVQRVFVSVRLVVVALAAGTIAFASLSGFLVAGGAITWQPQQAGTLLPVLVLAALGAASGYVVLRRAIAANLRRSYQTQADRDAPPVPLVSGYQTLTILGAARAEGPGLFGVVVFLRTGQWVALAVPAVSLAALALLFPTRDKLARFVVQVTGEPMR